MRWMICCLAIFAALFIVCLHPALAAPRGFHTPQSEAERALDKILGTDDDVNLVAFALGEPFYNPKKDPGYAKLFTPTLLQALRKKQADLVREDCGGKYQEGELCGLDYDPIICGQDRPDKFVYRTLKSGAGFALVMAAWPDSTSEDKNAFYGLVKSEAGVWRLDAISCPGADTFNLLPTPDRSSESR